MHIYDLIKSKFKNREVAVLVKEDPIIIHFVPCNDKGAPTRQTYHFAEKQPDLNTNIEVKPINRTTKEIVIGKPIEKDGENILMWDGEVL